MSDLSQHVRNINGRIGRKQWYPNILVDPSPMTRCRELALQWLESNRAVMYDPTKADWFLQYTDGLGHKNGVLEIWRQQGAVLVEPFIEHVPHSFFLCTHEIVIGSTEPLSPSHT
jgi:hypothetical protein